jgi:putative ABC transport system ATP-binding protein
MNMPGRERATRRTLRAAPDPSEVLIGHRLYREFHRPGSAPFALRDVSLTVHRGESVALLGDGGSGKTSLLALLTGIDEPDSGFVHVAGRQLNLRTEAERSRLRAAQIGMLYAFGNLLDHLTVAQNIVFARHLAARRGYRDLATRLAAVGLDGRGDCLPADLSPGDRSRAALAVALANDPPLLVADEPTDRLDEADATALLAMLKAQAERGAAVLLSTRSAHVASICDRVLHLETGELREFPLSGR